MQQRPQFANVGNVIEIEDLQKQGRALLRAEELGPRTRWDITAAQTAQAVRGAKRLVELEGKLPGLRKGETKPADANEQARLTPGYESLEGWSESTQGARSWADLPANAIKYVRRVEELIGAPVALLSTSPDRDDTIMVRDPFVDR